MSNDSPITVRFEKLKADSLSKKCTDFKDLPQLICEICWDLCSFGGYETFTQNNFKKHDVCQCGLKPNKTT